MKEIIKVDLEEGIVYTQKDNDLKGYNLNTPDAFKIISDIWLRCGWDTKYVYSFTWLGRPIIQLPEDMIRIQEVIYSVKPDVIIETGVAHGGSLIFYASLCKAIGKGRVIGIDIEIRPHNRKAIEQHELFSYIKLIEGSSVELSVVEQIKKIIKTSEKVLVILDSCHTKEHVLKELEAYSNFVSKDSYIIVMDGIMGKIVGAPRTEPDWDWNNPKEAAVEFVSKNNDFKIEEPEFPFNEGVVDFRVTYCPSAYLKRVG